MLLAIQTVGFRGRNNFVVRLVGCQLCMQNGVRSVFWRSLGVNYTVSMARRVGWLGLGNYDHRQVIELVVWG